MLTCQNIFVICVKNLRTKVRAANPGIQNRLNLLSQDTPDITKINFNEEIENLELDTSKTAALYEVHQRESANLKKAIKFKQIERKYFSRTVLPNLLTWSEKEQIRFLHNSDSATWTPEKLAQSFPATPQIIQKLLKSQWKPLVSRRIKNHDEGVISNWKALEIGELKLPASLERHVRTFVSRKHLSMKDVQTVELSSPVPNTKSTEFSDLVKKNKESHGSDVKGLKQKHQASSEETFILGGKSKSHKNSELYTLDSLRKKLQNTDEPTLLDKALMRGAGSQTVQKSEIVNPHKSDVPSVIVYGPKEMKTFKSSGDLYCDDIKLKIAIPQDKRIEGKIYKVKDCFYDDTGDFLYRVPGLY